MALSFAAIRFFAVIRQTMKAPAPPSRKLAGDFRLRTGLLRWLLEKPRSAPGSASLLRARWLSILSMPSAPGSSCIWKRLLLENGIVGGGIISVCLFCLRAIRGGIVAWFCETGEASIGTHPNLFKISGLSMSGHSKWATIKHKKGALDAKRGKIFTRLIKEITIAAKNGGGDPDTNPRLRGAIVAAKPENMPADNIKRAIQRGTGELPGANYEEFSLEGYGPGGVAVLLDTNTDNRNRTVSEIRHVFGKNGGNMADAGAVSWMFHKKGDILIAKTAAKEDDLMNIVLESGGE